MSLFDPPKKRTFKKVNVDSLQENEKVSSHYDFEKNKKFAKGFIENTLKPELQHFMEPGVKVVMGENSENIQTHVLVCFTPGKERPMGNFAWPIYFDQDYVAFKSEFKKIFINYQSYANR